jgi:hypothetical protein
MTPESPGTSIQGKVRGKHGIGTERNSDRGGLPRFPSNCYSDPEIGLRDSAGRELEPRFSPDYTFESLHRRTHRRMVTH